MTNTIVQKSILSDTKIIDCLRQQIRAIEESDSIEPLSGLGCQKLAKIQQEKTISLGNQKIDAALPWNGFPTHGLHEIFGDIVALGFSTTLIIRTIKTYMEGSLNPKILWCHQGRDLYGQGLAQFGVDPSYFIFVHGKNDKDILWAMEEGLRSSCFTTVVGNPHKVSPVVGRRLNLAAERGRTMGLLIRTLSGSTSTQTPISSSLTRWRVTSVPSAVLTNGIRLGPSRWHLELQRFRLSAAYERKLESTEQHKSWQVEWCNETGNFSVVTDLCNGSD